MAEDEEHEVRRSDLPHAMCAFPYGTLFGDTCKMTPPATKGNNKTNKLLDKKTDKLEHKLADRLEDNSDKASRQRTHLPRGLEARVRQRIGNADMPSKKWKQEGIQCQTKRHKIFRKTNRPSNKGKREGIYQTLRNNGTQADKKGQPAETQHQHKYIFCINILYYITQYSVCVCVRG